MSMLRALVVNRVNYKVISIELEKTRFRVRIMGVLIKLLMYKILS